jgi:formiminotetrahydrofolate cyclodeaminase
MSKSFLHQLAQARPDPGGGAAAAYGAEVGLALLCKVVRLEEARPSQDEARRQFWSDHLALARRLARIFTRLREKDAEAYMTMARMLAAREKGKRVQAAVEEATRIPWQIMGQALLALELVAGAGAHCRAHLVSDLLVAAELLGGALQGAQHIAKANLPLFTAPSRRQDWVARLAQAAYDGLEATLKVRSQLLARLHAAGNAG